MCALHRHMCGCLCLAEFVSLEPRVCVCVRLAQAHVWGLLPCTGTCPFVVPSATFLLLCAFHRDICWACVLHRLSALSQGCVCALHRHMCAAAEAVSLATSVCVCPAHACASALSSSKRPLCLCALHKRIWFSVPSATFLWLCAFHRHICWTQAVSIERRVSVCVCLAQAHVWGLCLAEA